MSINLFLQFKNRCAQCTNTVSMICAKSLDKTHKKYYNANVIKRKEKQKMFSKFLIKKENELIKEISKEKNFFRMYAKAMKIEGLVKYMNNAQ